MSAIFIVMLICIYYLELVPFFTVGENNPFVTTKGNSEMRVLKNERFSVKEEKILKDTIKTLYESDKDPDELQAEICKQLDL